MPRTLAAHLLEAARVFPAVVLTGPRRAGKTTFLRRLFPDAGYLLLEDPDLRARAAADPRGLLDQVPPPVILDEIQNVPALFDHVRACIDREPRRMGRYFFTGSQEAPLMQSVTESMAGRAAILQMLPFSLAETPRVSLLDGGFPEVLASPRTRGLWFSSYLQTYLERDVRAITGIRDLMVFRRFIALLATRHGQVLNRSDIAAPLGVSVPTITQWLHILEITNQVMLVPPYFTNYGKRLIKSPKVYLTDSGLACHLLGITSPAELERSPFLGPLFEGFIASEILKSQINQGRGKALYYFRDQQGLEVDFLVPRPNGRVWMVECKAGRTVFPQMAAPLLALGRAAKDAAERLLLVHRRSPSAPQETTLAPGVAAMDVAEFCELLAPTAPAGYRRKPSATGSRPREKRRAAAGTGRSR